MQRSFRFKHLGCVGTDQIFCCQVTATVSRKRVAAMIDLTSDDTQLAQPVHPDMPYEVSSQPWYSAAPMLLHVLMCASSNCHFAVNEHMSVSSVRRLFVSVHVSQVKAARLMSFAFTDAWLTTL